MACASTANRMAQGFRQCTRRVRWIIQPRETSLDYVPLSSAEAPPLETQLAAAQALAAGLLLAPAVERAGEAFERACLLGCEPIHTPVANRRCQQTAVGPFRSKLVSAVSAHSSRARGFTSCRAIARRQTFAELLRLSSVPVKVCRRWSNSVGRPKRATLETRGGALSANHHLGKSVSETV